MGKIELLKSFDSFGEAEKAIAEETIDDLLYFSAQIEELKKLPMIRCSQKDKSIQKATPAAKLISDFSNKVDAKRKILLSMLTKQEISAADELLNKLKEFE